jgi:hypothetical protein
MSTVTVDQILSTSSRAMTRQPGVASRCGSILRPDGCLSSGLLIRSLEAILVFCANRLGRGCTGSRRSIECRVPSLSSRSTRVRQRFPLVSSRCAGQDLCGSSGLSFHPGPAGGRAQPIAGAAVAAGPLCPVSRLPVRTVDRNAAFLSAHWRPLSTTASADADAGGPSQTSQRAPRVPRRRTHCLRELHGSASAVVGTPLGQRQECPPRDGNVGDGRGVRKLCQSPGFGSSARSAARLGFAAIRGLTAESDSCTAGGQSCAF